MNATRLNLCSSAPFTGISGASDETPPVRVINTLLQRGVLRRGKTKNRFNGFYALLKTAEAVNCHTCPFHTPLKQGVNEYRRINHLPSWGILLAASVNSLGQPVITRQPTNQSVSLDANVTFQVTAIGTAPLSYQWRFDDLELFSGTNRTLAMTN